MNFNKLILVVIGFAFGICGYAQYYSQELNAYVFNTEMYKGEQIAVAYLPEVPVFPKLKTKKQEAFYWKTVRDVKKVYPYVKIVGAEYNRINIMLDTIPDKKLREKYLKKYEKQLLKQYRPVLEKFTLSQGKMMIKLINRETNRNAYSIIKEYRGGFVAWWWQVFAKMVGADLKDNYDLSKKEQDRIIERVIILYEAGLI